MQRDALLRWANQLKHYLSQIGRDAIAALETVQKLWSDVEHGTKKLRG
jgi:hypothetical protein